jgi:hypothetical protein
MMVALLIAAPAMALTEGSLRGTVLDEDTLPIPGVNLTLSSEALIGGAQERLTDVHGNFHFVGLPPGDYQITASKAGFQAVTVTQIRVNVNRTTVQNITLPVTGVAEVVEVKGDRRAVDVEDTTRGEVLTKEFLQRIPTGRSYQSAVGLAAGVLPGTGGNPNMAGAAYNENTYMLDGANITDPVTGTFSLNFNYDAIEQIEVLLGGYEPEYGVSLGGIINLVTETGTNNLEFDTSVFYQNGNWRPRMDARYTSDGFQLAPTDFDSTFQIIQISAKISGPVIRDRAWFIFSYQTDRTLIANTGIDVPRDYDGHYVLGKLTVQPTSEHRFTGFLQLNPTSIDNGIQSDPFVKAEAQERQAQGGFASQARWQWFLSPEANLDTQVVVQKTYIEVNAVPCTHKRDLGYHPCRADEPEGYVDWETPGRVGSWGAYDSVNYGYFYFDDRFRYQASSKLSVLAIDDPLGGTHDFKFGVEAVQTVWDQLQGYSGNTLYVDLNAVTYDPETFQNYYWLEITGPIKFRTSGSQWNLFAQDSYKPFPNLTIKYGIRFDNSVMRNDLGEPVLTGSLLGPRLYAAWDPFGDQKTKIAGGYGRFNDTGRLGVASFTSARDYGSKLYLGEYFGDDTFLNGQDQMYDIDPRGNPNTSHDNLRMPRVDEVILLVHREIIEDVALRVNLTGKFTRNMYEMDETNVIYDEDGSAIIGSRYADPFNDIWRLRTPALALRDYYQADFVLDKIQSRRWFGRLTYSYTQSIGSSTSALSGSFLNDPQSQYNYGPMGTDLRHVVRGFGNWSLPTDPWVQNIGVFIEYYSGAPLERRYWSDENFGYSLRIRDRGIYFRFPAQWSLSVKFSQDIDVRKGKLILDLEADNLFNNRAPENLSSLFYTENRLFIYNRQDPLRLQLGLRYVF